MEQIRSDIIAAVQCAQLAKSCPTPCGPALNAALQAASTSFPVLLTPWGEPPHVEFGGHAHG